MSDRTEHTRFAPSPTGQLHLGNARTAFFSWLAARASGGRFVLRVEDTDADRSDPAHEAALLGDLGWLGLDWDEGPDVGGTLGPYRQSERAAVHAAALERLRGAGHVYACFCSPEELQLSRRAQLAAGRPPRYVGPCATLEPGEVSRRIAAGARPAWRFRVPAGRRIEFQDAVHGPQAFATDDIGDFVVGRADGSAAFFLGNAVDDALMGITLVLRGDDHLANTPRQLLLLEALGLPPPSYGHLPLVLAPDGGPLSKRERAAGLGDLRAQGYRPDAICNYLLRLGHACAHDRWLGPQEWPAAFRLERVSRSAAHFDEVQLRHWQRQSLEQATEAQLAAWLGDRLEALGADADRRDRFLRVVRGNLLLPGDVESLVAMVVSREVTHSPEALTGIASAGRAFFAAAADAWNATPTQPFGDWARAVSAATGRRGAALYGPLRAALTGATHGPELGPLTALIGRDTVLRRLHEAERLADRPARAAAH